MQSLRFCLGAAKKHGLGYAGGRNPFGGRAELNAKLRDRTLRG